MSQNKVSLLLGDATKLDIKSNSVDLIITHPPYLGIDTQRYGGDATKQANYASNHKKMLKTLLAATKEMYRVLKPGGRLFIANGKKDQIDMDYVIQTLDKTDFSYVDFIIQNSYLDKNAGYVGQETIQTEAITTWHHFIKGEEGYYNPYMVKRWSNPVWDLDFNNIADPVDIKLMDNHHVYDVVNKELPKRIIEMFSKPGHVVLDPFGGSAIVAVTAASLGRMGISNDISADQLKAAEARIALTF